MQDDERINETGEVVDNTDYIEAIQALKQNSVDRSKYDALKAENKRLLDSIVNGTEVAQSTVEEEESVEDLSRRVLTDNHQTNLEYWTNVLKLRERLIEEGHPDPFVASSSQYSPTAIDYEQANKVASILQEMVDVADGDPNVFLNEYQRRVRDNGVPSKKK